MKMREHVKKLENYPKKNMDGLNAFPPDIEGPRSCKPIFRDEKSFG